SVPVVPSFPVDCARHFHFTPSGRLEKPNAGDVGCDLAQQLEELPTDVCPAGREGHARDISSWMRQALDESLPHGVIHHSDDGDGPGRLTGDGRGRSPRYEEYVDWEADEFQGQRG